MNETASKTKILHVARAAGGIGVYIDLITRYTNDLKFEHIVVHEDDYETISFKNKSGNPIRTYKLNIPREINPAADLKAVIRMRKIIKRENPQIIHVHSAKGGVIGRLAAWGTGIPVLYTPNAFSYLSTPNPFKRFVFLSIERILKEFNSKLLASSPSELERGVKEVGFKKEKAFLYNNSIEPIEVAGLTMPRTWPDKYICTVGRPSYQKRLDMMIKVLAALKKEWPDIHLVVMGVGFYSPELDRVKQLIKKYGLKSNVTLLEWTDKENVHYIISNARLYISTARYEGLPFSVIEALALGKPVVATRVDGNKDLVIDGYNGYLVEGENISEMKNKVLEILQNQALAETFGLRSEQLFEENYNILKTIGLLENIYLKNRGGK